jgi:hypothetical protein
MNGSGAAPNVPPTKACWLEPATPLAGGSKGALVTNPQDTFTAAPLTEAPHAPDESTTFTTTLRDDPASADTATRANRASKLVARSARARARIVTGARWDRFVRT